MNFELADEVKAAMKEMRSAERKSVKAYKLAESRLLKWHEERNARRHAHDEMVLSGKAAAQSQKILDTYKSMLENSPESRHKMRKEWETEAAARKQGGARRWPVWVVQLICELLINGTSPKAIPANIMTMYTTLYEKEPDETPPSPAFVRQCRTVVQVIGETIAAVKLANAKEWGQLWTDATTRRQIPFTALIIGLLSEDSNEAIDPIVVSSCIFMENETAESQAEGIIDKVSLSCDKA